MKALVDLDGVLVSFVSGACAWHNIAEPYYQNDEMRGVWDFVAHIDMEPDSFWSALGFDFWSTLPWMVDGQEILKTVEEYFGLKNVCLLTSPCHTKGCVDGKREWIKKNIPEYGSRVLFGSCKEFCANPRHVLLDDADHNCKAFADAGGTGLLVPRIWNSKHELAGQALDHVNKALDYWMEKTI